MFTRTVLICLVPFLALLLKGAGTAQAAVEISSKPTKNMTCTGGVCAPTAAKAVLNVGDLTNMLASGDVTVQSGSLAHDIEIDAALSWTSTQRLTLDSYHSIFFKKAVTVAGTGALTITTNDGGFGGDFYFLNKGHVEFWDINSDLAINGPHYRLFDSLESFQSFVRKGGGDGYRMAQAKNWNLSGEIFRKSPVKEFGGTFEGLGNSISHLKIRDGRDSGVGLFADLYYTAVVRDLNLSDVDILGTGQFQFVGALAGAGGPGLIQGVHVTGTVSGAGSEPYSGVGGLIGGTDNAIYSCWSNAAVFATGNAPAGGLIGSTFSAYVEKSYSTGRVSGGAGPTGGLVGKVASEETYSGGEILDSYATGAVSVSGAAPVGGSFGERGPPGIDGGDPPIITASYSLGSVSGGAPLGGSIGEDDAAGSGISNDYWDLDTSGISNPHQGAGNVPDDPGITGLTDAQLKSGLPAGFDPKIWAINPKINNGYPYLIANPPPK